LQYNSLDELDMPVFHAPGFCGAVRSIQEQVARYFLPDLPRHHARCASAGGSTRAETMRPDSRGFL